MTELAGSAVQAVCAALLDMGLAAAIGLLVLFPRLERASVTALARTTGRWLGLAAPAYVAVAVCVMSGAGPADLPAALGTVLMHTGFGHVQCLLLAGCALFACALRLAGARGRLAAMAVGALMMLVARAGTGHAADAGWTGAAIWIHGAHVLAVSAWAGAVFVVVLAQRQPPGPALAHRLSSVSTWALALAFGAGAVGALDTLSAARAPWGSDYLFWLLLKFAGVALAVALGAFNRWARLPGLCRGNAAAAGSFRRILLAEAGVLVLVVAAAARLGLTMPPG
jgi:putative copper resistance protein D